MLGVDVLLQQILARLDTVEARLIYFEAKIDGLMVPVPASFDSLGELPTPIKDEVTGTVDSSGNQLDHRPLKSLPDELLLPLPLAHEPWPSVAAGVAPGPLVVTACPAVSEDKDDSVGKQSRAQWRKANRAKLLKLVVDGGAAAATDSGKYKLALTDHFMEKPPEAIMTVPSDEARSAVLDIDANQTQFEPTQHHPSALEHAMVPTSQPISEQERRRQFLNHDITAKGYAHLIQPYRLSGSTTSGV